jgi:hypothetical protein
VVAAVSANMLLAAEGWDVRWCLYQDGVSMSSRTALRVTAAVGATPFLACLAVAVVSPVTLERQAHAFVVRE